MKETGLKIGSLLLLYARDSSNLCQEFLQQIDVPSYTSICVNDPLFSHHHALQNPDKARIQLIFFSPGFLNFLECKPEEAFIAFRYIEPASSLAIFCCGLREQQIMCYHMAPLNSYYSWPKFEVANTSGNGIEFPQHLLQTVQEAFLSNDSYIVIVPKLINKDCNTVYVIFQDAIKDASVISVYLESASSIQVIPENMNNYVFYFKVPDTLMDSCRTIGVKIHQSRRILASEELHVIRDFANRCGADNRKSFREPKASVEEIELDNQLLFLSDLGSTSGTEFDDETVTPFPQEIDVDSTKCLIDLCKKYGQEELIHFIGESDVLTLQPKHGDRHYAEDLGSREEIEHDIRSLIVNTDFSTDDEDSANEDNDGSPLKRSLSLPSLLRSVDESNGTNGEYIDMRPPALRNMGFFPHHRGEDNVPSSPSNNSYVSMKWPRDSVDSLKPLKRGLSESQQDLLEYMMAFKRGEKTISNVEQLFQIWQRRHATDINQYRVNHETQKNSPSFIPGLRRLRRKDARKMKNGTEEHKRLLHSSQVNSRQISNTSPSSTSSRTSDISCSPAQPENINRQHDETVRGVSTGWIPNFPATNIYPLHPEVQPPPLPPRSISQSKNESDQKPHPVYGNLPWNLNGCANDVLEDLDDDENIQTLIEFCDENGLEEISDHFLRDYCSKEPRGYSILLKGGNSAPMKKDTSDSRIHWKLPVDNWDTAENEHGLCSMQRSLSLPSSLCTAEVITDNRASDTEIYPQNYTKHECDKSPHCTCEDCLPNSYRNNIYMSMAAKNDPDQNQSSLICLSNSQQELLELMYAFKRGQKTISQVEQQFQEWHQRNIEASSRRETQLLELKNNYVKSVKLTTFGLAGIRDFILGKPRKKIKISNPDVSRNVKKRKTKSERDSKRLSKISFTSTSSGVSDTSDNFRNVCFFNPEYGHYMEDESSKNNTTAPKSSPRKTPPPPPVRFTPISPAYQLPDVVQKNVNVSQQDTMSKIQDSASKIKTKAKIKPKPPPKPGNLLIKDNPGKEPASPDYIEPNPVRFGFPSQTSKMSNRKISNEGPQKYLTPPKYPVPFVPTLSCISKKNELSIFVNKPNTVYAETIYIPDFKKKSSQSPSKASSGAKTATQKRQLFRIPKTSKKEESMFYITSRKWSSFPNLKNAQLVPEPIYLEIIGEQDRRSKSISES